MINEVKKCLGASEIEYDSEATLEALVNLLRTSAKVNWIYISIFQKLSEGFIREFQNEIDWHYVSHCQELSEDFIREFEEKVNWEYISRYQKLSESFIREFQHRVAWVAISINQTLSESFCREFSDRVHWKSVVKYKQDFGNIFTKESQKPNSFEQILAQHYEMSKFPEELCVVQDENEPTIFDSSDNTVVFECVLKDVNCANYSIVKCRPYLCKEDDETFYGWTDIGGTAWFDHFEKYIHGDNEKVIAWRKLNA